MLTYLFTVIQSTKQIYTTLNHDTTFIHAHQPHISNHTYWTRSFPGFFPNNLKRRTFFLYNYCLNFANKVNKIANSVLSHDNNNCFLSNQFFNGQVIRNVLQGKNCHAKIKKTSFFWINFCTYIPRKYFIILQLQRSQMHINHISMDTVTSVLKKQSYIITT